MAKKYGPYICTNCNYDGKAYYCGSWLLTIFLLFFLIIPGVAYFLWAYGRGKVKCPECKQSTMIPIESRKGQKLLEEIAGDDAEFVSAKRTKLQNIIILIIAILLFFSIQPFASFVLSLSEGQ